MRGLSSIFFLISFLVCCTYSVTGQKLDIEIDYTVQYLLSESNDTITISIGEQGKYMYTESPLITNAFKKTFQNSLPSADNAQTKAKMLLNGETNEMFFHIKFGKHTILMNLNLADFVVPTKKDDTSRLMASRNNEDIITILGQKYPLYDVFPDSNPNEKIQLAFDSEYPLDYAKYISNILKLTLGNAIAVELPSGVLLYGKNPEGQEILRALDIKKEHKKTTINLDFNLE